MIVGSQIYLSKSHGVWSWNMPLVPLVPIVGTVFLGLIFLIERFTERHYQGWLRIANNGMCTALGLFTTYNILRGIFDVAGTASTFTDYFLVGGAISILIALLGIIKSLGASEEMDNCKTHITLRLVHSRENYEIRPGE